jgi:hypothetical protein
VNSLADETNIIEFEHNFGALARCAFGADNTFADAETSD